MRELSEKGEWACISAVQKVMTRVFAREMFSILGALDATRTSKMVRACLILSIKYNPMDFEVKAGNSGNEGWLRFLVSSQGFESRESSGIIGGWYSEYAQFETLVLRHTAWSLEAIIRKNAAEFAEVGLHFPSFE
eukprot:11446-Rhodomonas_salina.3